MPTTDQAFIWRQGRAFSFSATTVARYASAFARGLQSRGVAATAKHFPGLGSATTDTDFAHLELHPTAAQRAAALKPYETMIPAGVDSVMAAVAGFDAYDSSGAVAALSRPIITGLLRGRLRFSGVVITDALGSSTGHDERTAGVLAAAAGADVLLYTDSAPGELARVAVGAVAGRNQPRRRRRLLPPDHRPQAHARPRLRPRGTRDQSARPAPWVRSRSRIRTRCRTRGRRAPYAGQITAHRRAGVRDAAALLRHEFRRPLANLPSASTTDFPASAPSRRASPSARASLGPLLSARNFYLGLIVIALAVGGLSLLIPSTPSYDPWSWIVWGREIIHVNLQTTGGPTWKPLPVIFTTVFALFGKAEPDLWLVVARAGAFAAVVMVFRLSVRLTRQIGTYFVRPPAAADAPPGRADLLLAWLPGAAGGRRSPPSGWRSAAATSAPTRSATPRGWRRRRS